MANSRARAAGDAGDWVAPFELPDRALAERGIAVQIVGVEDRAHIAQRVPGDVRDLSLAAVNLTARVDDNDLVADSLARSRVRC
jgi:hypothetical protein